MDQALRNTPVETFKVPSGITMVKVNIETGLPVNEDSQETIMEAFIEGSVPEVKEGSEKEPSSGTSVKEKPSEGSSAHSRY